ncbi:MAG TPA: cytochrome c biogenesis CcdA family protein [Ilumatobacteraceae bacterium]|nr:cytochrome c biogenesis CcdA family protein [Ilumatobacteraceae bacterium]
MIDAPLALAFTAGMVASINPCGFALLPAYVASFVAGDDAAIAGHRRIARAALVSAAVSIGFAITFVLVGVVFDAASGWLRERMPWLTIAIGSVMLVVGVAAVVGWKPRLPFQAPAATPSRSTLGMVGFGFTYAMVSLSCTLGPFLAVTGFAMRRSLIGGLVTYITYALGMGAIILALSVSAALAHNSVAGALRSVSRWAPRLAGVLLITSGAYAVWYGRHELEVYGGDLREDRLVQFGLDLQTRFIVFTDSIGAVRIAVGVVAITVLAYVVLRLRSDRPAARAAQRRHTTATEQEQHA